MKTLKMAKEAAIEFMTAFHSDREWWVVGGLLRDSDMGKPFKDIDIFINGYATDLLPEGAEIGDKNAYLLRAYTVEAYPYMGETYEINLIFMRGDRWSLKSMSDRCDFGICQIGWCPVTDVAYRSELYYHDKGHRTLTLARNTALGRVTRMEEKFPAYSLRNPKGFLLDDKRFWAYDEETQKLSVKYTQVYPKVPKVSHTM